MRRLDAKTGDGGIDDREGRGSWQPYNGCRGSELGSSRTTGVWTCVEEDFLIVGSAAAVPGDTRKKNGSLLETVLVSMIRKTLW